MLEKRSTALAKFWMVFSASPVLDAVPDAVLQMALQHHLPRLVQGGLGGVDLSQDVLTGHVLVHHPVDGLHLTDDFPQAAVEVVRIHTLSH